jgi:hypothetical protein
VVSGLHFRLHLCVGKCVLVMEGVAVPIVWTVIHNSTTRQIQEVTGSIPVTGKRFLSEKDKDLSAR